MSIRMVTLEEALTERNKAIRKLEAFQNCQNYTDEEAIAAAAAIQIWQTIAIQINNGGTVIVNEKGEYHLMSEDVAPTSKH